MTTWEVLVGLFGVLMTILVVDQFRTRQKTSSIPGPLGYVPVLGGLIEMVMDPERFWTRQDGYGRVSWNYLAGRLMIHTTDPALSRKVLNSDSPNQLKMAVHPNAELILGKENMAFMQGAVHKELRTQLLPLFTRRALSHYIDLQDDITRSKIADWTARKGVEAEFRPLARDLNTMTSQLVFVGPYLTGEQMEGFVADYQRMNDGFLSFPLNLPGTALNKAVKAREKIVVTLTEIAAKSKERMSKEGEEPKCLLDYWMEKMVKMVQEAEKNGTPLPTHHENKEIAFTILDFLFASQDASTSSIVWTMHFLSDHPEVLEKVREEQRRVRENHDTRVTHDLLVQMTYTRQVIKEILRIRPPATLVPQMAQEDYQLTPEILVPKGTLITPSLWASSYYGYPNARDFDPDRFSEERGEDQKFSQSFLVFGAGPHACLGKEYAINHLMTFLSLISLGATWTRRRTPASDKVAFGPTIYPADCLITFH